MTRPLVIEQPSIPEMFGIRFRPGRALPFFRARISEITDSRAPLGDLSGERLASIAERVAGEKDAARRVAIVEAALRRHVHDASPERRVEKAVTAIVRSSGTVPVEVAARSAGVTRQHLGRLFDVHVGLTPKTFARIVSFRTALRLGRTRPWADVAATLGYSDRSHLIADFREFTGTTPVPFFLSAGGAKQ